MMMEGYWPTYPQEGAGLAGKTEMLVAVSEIQESVTEQTGGD